MTAFAVLIAVQLVTYILGLNLILSGYEKDRLRQYEQLAVEILQAPDNTAPPVLPGANPFFVFSSDKTLLYSNKGKGRSLSVEELRPVSA